MLALFLKLGLLPGEAAGRALDPALWDEPWVYAQVAARLGFDVHSFVRSVELDGPVRAWVAYELQWDTPESARNAVAHIDTAFSPVCRGAMLAALRKRFPPASLAERMVRFVQGEFGERQNAPAGSDPAEVRLEPAPAGDGP